MHPPVDHRHAPVPQASGSLAVSVVATPVARAATLPAAAMSAHTQAGSPKERHHD
jgi:hypothetical protein